MPCRPASGCGRGSACGSAGTALGRCDKGLGAKDTKRTIGSASGVAQTLLHRIAPRKKLKAVARKHALSWRNRNSDQLGNTLSPSTTASGSELEPEREASESQAIRWSSDRQIAVVPASNGLHFIHDLAFPKGLLMNWNIASRGPEAGVLMPSAEPLIFPPRAQPQHGGLQRSLPSPEDELARTPLR